MTHYHSFPKGYTVAERFVVEAPIGRGRSSAVYRALDLRARTEVALKVLDPFLAQDPTSVERFAREVAILRSLNHPNVVRLYDFLRDGEAYCICMEYIEGLDAKAYIARFGKLPVVEFLPIAKSLTAALEACHGRKVLHRDLKPQNILITPNHDVRLVDFGVSRINTMSDLTKTGTLLGTPEYMAPELFVSTAADPRTDIYALGVVFYELLAGRPPYVATSLSTIMSQQLRGQIEPLSTYRRDLPPWLESIVLKCLKVDPNARYQSCYELLRDLQSAERALAVYEAKRQATPCLSCKTELIPGLPFCHHCGTFTRDQYAKGPYALVLYSCEDPDALAARLLRLFPHRSRTALRARLSKSPLVICTGVSHGTATNLVNELAVVPCELGITRRLLSEFRLPRVYAGFGVLALCPVLLTPGRSFLGTLALTLCGESVLVALYLRQISPLIRLAAVRDRALVPLDPEIPAFARSIRQLSDPSLKAALGKIVSTFLHISDSKAMDRPCVGEIRSLVLRAIEVARTLESHAVYLGSRSLNEIRDKLRAVELRLAETRETERAASLMQTRMQLQREFRDYRSIEELHSKLHIAVLNLNALLKKIDDLPGGSLDSVGAEMQELAQDFALDEIDASCAATA